MTIDALNERFAVDGHVAFGPGAGGLVRADVANALATATVYLQGAHVTGFAPRGAEPVLWLSERALYQSGKAIRGGIPVCWPWFGPDPENAARPQHGFARTSTWQVESTAALGDGSTRLRFGFTDTDETRAWWPHAFHATLTVTVGRSLDVALACRNLGDEAFASGGALHTYLAVSDIGQTRVLGLDGCDYLDQLEARARRTQRGPVTFDGNVDRIYTGAPRVCDVVDGAGARTIRLRSSGSATTVVWNPGREKAAAMADFPDDGYRRMVCVEAANAVHDARRVEPGGTHTLSQRISLAAD